MVECPSVCPFVIPFDSSSGVQQVCCRAAGLLLSALWAEDINQ